MSKLKSIFQSKRKSFLSCISITLALLIQLTPLSSLTVLAASTGFSFDQIQLFSDDACTQPLPSSNVGKTDKVVIKFPFTAASNATLSDYNFEIPKEIPIISAQDIPVYDTVGALVGTAHLVKSTAGQPTVCSFTLSKAGESGYFVISSQFNVGDDENTTPVTITFKADGVAMPIDVNFAQGAPQISKTHSAFNSNDGSTGTIQWTISVNTKQNTVTGGVFRDPLPAGMTIVDGSFTVDGNSSVTPDISTDNGIQTLAYTFPEPSFSNVRTITFKTSVPPSMYNTDIKNNAYLDYTGDNNTPATASDMATAPVDYIDKNGVYDSGTKKITWTIHFNTSNLNIANAIVTDKLPAGLVPSSVRIGGSDVTRNDSAVKGSGEYTFDTGTNTLTYYAPASINSVHTLTIVTPVPDSYFQTNSSAYSNSATLTGDSGVYPSSGVKSNNATPTGPGGPLSSSTLEKTFSSYDATTGIITWHVVINRNQATLTNTQFSDTIPVDQTYVTDSAQFYDSSFTSQLPTQPGSISYSSSTLSWDPGTISDTYYIQYQTKLNPDIAARNENYTTKPNTATLKNDGITTTKSVSQTLARGVIQKNAVTYDYINRTISWNIDVNKERMSLTGNTIAADGTNSNSGVVVKDDLSAMAAYQFNFVDGSTVTVTSQDNPSTPITATKVSSLSALTVANTYYYDAASKLLYINLGNLDTATLAAREKIIKFNTPLASSVDVNSYFAGNWTYNVPNTASLLDDQYTGTEAKSTATQEIDNNVIKKIGQYQTGADYIDWEVKLNQNAIDLGQVSLDDDLSGKPLTLDTSSVRLFRQTLLSNGQFQLGTYNAATNPYSIDMSDEITLPPTSVKYSATDKIFHFTAPENVSGRPYLLLFRTYIDKSQSGTNAQDISNTIQFTGTAADRTNTGTAKSIKFQWGYGAAAGHAGSVTVEKTDEKGNPLSGATFDLLDTNGNLLQVSQATGSDGKVTIDQLTYNVSYQVKEDTAPTNYEKDATPRNVKVNSTSPTASLTFTDTLKIGTIQLHKIDADGNSLAGATFTLYNAGGNAVGTPQASDSNGLVTFSGVPYGTYTVQETGIPADYMATGSGITADLTDGNSNVKSNTLDLGTVTNTIKTLGISLTKVGVGGKKLPGATFTLCHDALGKSPVLISGVPVTSTSDVNGLLQFTNIPYGDYYLVETTAPADYAPVTPISVSLHDNNPAISGGALLLGQVADSLKLGSITFTKLDEDGNILAGADFVLKDAAGNPVGSPQISDQNGYVSFTNVPYGDGYSITETKAPADFQTLAAPITGISLHSPKVTLQSVSDSRLIGSITFTKVDENGNSLADAEFTLYNSNGDQVGTPQTSDTNGKVTFVNVPFKDGYTIKETKAPQNYGVHPAFTVNLHTDTYDYGNVMDTLLRGSIQVTKTDPDGHPLAGAIFTLYDADGKTVNQAVSNQSGTANFFNITYGNYSIQETAAPEGYNIDKSMHTVRLDAKNPAPEIQIVNTRIPSIPNPPTGSSGNISLVEVGILALISSGVILSKRLRFR